MLNAIEHSWYNNLHKSSLPQAESYDLHEIDALCVLDFYVHESCQRQGIGKLLFEVSYPAVQFEITNIKVSSMALAFFS